MPSRSPNSEKAAYSETRSLLYRTRLPLAKWEDAVMATLVSPGSTASALQKSLVLGSYRTAWRMAGTVRMAFQAVDWPLLSGEVELCDVGVPVAGGKAQTIWLAVERRMGAPGLIRAWPYSGKPLKDINHIAEEIRPNAMVITCPLGQFRAFKELGFAHRTEPLGAADSLPAVKTIEQKFRMMLRARHHRGLATGALHSYLAEHVFRHNAGILGWGEIEQFKRVMQALRQPRLSA